MTALGTKTMCADTEAALPAAGMEESGVEDVRKVSEVVGSLVGVMKLELGEDGRPPAAAGEGGPNPGGGPVPVAPGGASKPGGGPVAAEEAGVEDDGGPTKPDGGPAALEGGPEDPWLGDDGG